MSNLKLSADQLQQRALAVGLLVVVTLIVILVIIVPLVSMKMEFKDTKESLVLKLQQYERILAKSDAVTASMQNITSAQETQEYFNRQATDALASADMQEFIKKTIVEAGGQLSSTQALPVINKENFKRITVSVRMTGSSQVLRAVLYKIETSEPLIIINQFDIRPMRGARNPVTRQMEPSNELNINFQAVSFMRSSAS
jgi:general secretion pathway protein M